MASASSYLEPLKSGAVGCASKTVSSRLQMALLDQTKTVVESMQNLMVAAKESGGNRKVGDDHSDLDGAFEILTMKLFFVVSVHNLFVS